MNGKNKSKTSSKAYSSVTLVSAGSMVNALMGFIYLTGVAKILSLDDFGKYALLTSLLTLISRILDFGTNSLFVAHHDKPKGFLESKLILFLVSLPITFVILYFLKLMDTGIVVIMILGLIAYGLNYTVYSVFQKSQKYMQLVILNGIPAVIKAFFGIFLFFNIIQLNLEQSFAIFTYSIFASLLVLLFSSIKNELTFGYDFKEGLNFIKKAISPGTSQLIYESWQTLNNVLIKFFNTFSDVGIFSMANKISNIFTLLSISVFTVLLPKNSERKNVHKSGYDFRETALISTAMLLSSVVLIFIAEVFIEKVFGAKFRESIKFLDLLIVAGAISAIQNFIENYFYVENTTNLLVLINGTKLAVLVLLSLWLIPFYGLYSLAVVNLIASVTGLLFAYVLIIRSEKRKVR